MRITVTNGTRHTILGNDIRLASSLVGRLKGLLGCPGLAPGQGLVLEPCRSIHTFFMRFPIDVVFYDKEQRVVAVRENLAPYRLTSVVWRARGVVELPAGTVLASKTKVGDQLIWR